MPRNQDLLPREEFRRIARNALLVLGIDFILLLIALRGL